MKTRTPTNDVIQFPLNKDTNQFNRDLYIPTMTEGKISAEEINQVFEDLELATCKIPTPNDNMLILCYRFAFPFVVMLFLDAQEALCDYEYKPRPKTWWFFYMYCFFAVIYWIFNQRSQIGKVKENTKKIIHLFQPDFSKKGFIWIIPEDFPECIELHGGFGNNDKELDYRSVQMYITSFENDIAPSWPSNIMKHIVSAITKPFWKDQKNE